MNKKPLFRSLMHADRVVFPDDLTTCKTCGMWDATDPRVIGLMEAQGRDPRDAHCKCGDIRSAHASELRKASCLSYREGGRRNTFQFNAHGLVVQITDGNRKAWSAAHEFTKERTEADKAVVPPFLLLAGPNGTGKSHILEAIGWRLLERQVRVRYVVAADLMMELRRSEGKGTAAELMDEVRDIPVLLLDELGGRRLRMNDYAQEQLGALIDYRYRREARTVITSNTDDYASFADEAGSGIADRLFDRHTGLCRQEWMESISYRTG